MQIHWQPLHQCSGISTVVISQDTTGSSRSIRRIVSGFFILTASASQAAIPAWPSSTAAPVRILSPAKLFDSIALATAMATPSRSAVPGIKNGVATGVSMSVPPPIAEIWRPRWHVR